MDESWFFTLGFGLSATLGGLIGAIAEDGGLRILCAFILVAGVLLVALSVRGFRRELKR
jgi:hypothetical protein